MSVIRIASKKPATASLIFLHGLGDSGQGWSFLGDFLHQMEDFKNLRLVLPNAPDTPVTINGGMKMPSWFDIYELGNIHGPQDKDGFLKSCTVIQSLVDEEISKGIAPDKIIVGGFSQGGALALGSAALLDKKIGGIMALSGFCTIPQILKESMKENNKNTAIFHGHGTADPVVPYEMGVMCADFYRSQGFSSYDMKSYPGMAHSTCNEELIDIVEFLRKVY